MKRWEQVVLVGMAVLLLAGILLSVWTYDWRPAVSGFAIVVVTSLSLMCAQTPSQRR